MSSSDRLNSIAANLDDLQAGMEACSRAAKSLQADAGRCSHLIEGPTLRAIDRHATDVIECARDQCALIGELRQLVSQLPRDEPPGSTTSPPSMVAAAKRGP